MSEASTSPPARKRRILIGDDHQIVREGLKAVIELEPDLQVAGEAGTSAETLARLHEGDWDLVLLDIGLPDRSGVDTLHLIRSRVSDVPVLIVSGFPEDQYAINLLRAGANGYLRKDAPANEIVRAIRTVLEGRRYTSAAVSELLLARLGDGERPPHHDLSEREFQVLCQLAAGRTVSQIAAELFISVKTVSTYRTRVLDKLGLATNAELAHYAIRHGLVN